MPTPQLQPRPDVADGELGADPRLCVRITDHMGRGVFARTPIARGEELGVFHTLRIPPEERRALAGTTLSRFWFEDDRDQSASLVLGIVELINHSPRANVDRTWHLTREGEVVRLFAIQPIAAGEQLFFDYRFAADGSEPPWAWG